LLHTLVLLVFVFLYVLLFAVVLILSTLHVVEEFQGLWRKRPPALLPDLVCADCARAGKGKNQEG